MANSAAVLPQGGLCGEIRHIAVIVCFCVSFANIANDIVCHLSLSLQCDFPGLGRMVTNRAGRFEFVFEPLIMEWFEREHYALIREVGSSLRSCLCFVRGCQALCCH